MKERLRRILFNPGSYALYFLYSASLVFILFFFVLPVGNIFLKGLFVFFKTNNPLPSDFLSYMIKVTGNTLTLGFLTTFWTLLIALPTSVLIVKFGIRQTGLWSALLTVPMVSPAFISSFAVIILLGRSGVITLILKKAGIELPSVFGLNGLLITQILHTVPYAMLILISGLKGIPRHIEEASLSMGSSIPRNMTSIVIPYIMPHILMSGLMVFLSSIGDVGSPLIIGGNYEVLSLSIFSNYISFLDDERIPLIFSLWIIFISFIMLFIVNRIMMVTDSRYKKGYGTMVYDIPSVRKAGNIWIALLSVVFFLPYCVILIHSFSPVWVFELFPDSFTVSNYEKIFFNMEAVFNTVFIVAVSAPLMLILGLVLSHMFRKRKKLKWINYITLIPFVLPGVVIGISLLQTFSDIPIMGDRFTSSISILIIAISIRRLPFVLKTLEAGFCRIDESEEETAVSLGAGDIRVFFSVFLPQIKPVIYASIIIAVVKIITELSASLIINPPGWQNMSLYIAYYVEEGLVSRASAMSILLILFIVLGTFISFYLSGRFSAKAGSAENWESVMLGKSFEFYSLRDKRFNPGKFKLKLFSLIDSFSGNLYKKASIVVDRNGSFINASSEFLRLMKAGSLEHLQIASNLFSIINIRNEIHDLFESGRNIEEKPASLFNFMGERFSVTVTARIQPFSDEKKKKAVVFITPASKKKRQIREFEKLKALADEAELKALKAQINPHFFFNTLNSIVEMIESEPAKAVKVTESLADLFRFTLASTRRDNIPLSEEIDHIRQYISILKARFGSRLVAEFDIDDKASVLPVPPMILQPIVENAVYHGTNERGVAEIKVSVILDGKDMIIKVSDKGTGGFNYSELTEGKGTGIMNVENRLQVLYKKSLIFEENSPSGLLVIMKIPAGKV